MSHFRGEVLIHKLLSGTYPSVLNIGVSSFQGLGFFIYGVGIQGFLHLGGWNREVPLYKRYPHFRGVRFTIQLELATYSMSPRSLCCGH